MPSLKRRVSSSDAGNVSRSEHDAWPDEGWAKKFPLLAEFLSVTWWDEETPRTKGTFVVFFEDGHVKLCLNDKDGGYVAFVAAKGFQEALVAAEKGLAGDSLDWRRTAAGKARGVKRP